MATPTLQETRTVGRILSSTLPAMIPGVKDNVFTHSAAAAIFLGQDLMDRFGTTPLAGSGSTTQPGGERIEIRHRLGKSPNTKWLSGPMGTVNTARNDNLRRSSANWKHLSGAITLSFTDELINRGEARIISLLTDSTFTEIKSMVDAAVEAFYDPAGGANMATGLPTFANANDTVQTLSGATFSGWNSRGLSARGTAAGSVSFASGSFAAQGLSDMRTAWNNASEGSLRPRVVLTGYTEFGFYEGSLQPQERFTNTSMADGGFTNLAFKNAPVMPDDAAERKASGQMFFVNPDIVYAVFLEGANFDVMPSVEATQQESTSRKVVAKFNYVCEDRRLVNKMTGITA